MPDESEVLRAFQSMRTVLRERGILILTQGTSDRQWREKPRFILAGSDAQVSRVFVIDYLQKGARYNVLDIFHGEGEHRLESWSCEYPCILLRDDYERLLQEAGFASVCFYGGYTLDSYDKDRSDRLIVVAQK